MTTERLEEAKDIRARILTMPIDLAYKQIYVHRNNHQLLYDISRRECSRDESEDLIYQLMFSRHPGSLELIEILKLLDLEEVNLFDNAGKMEKGRFTHALFTISQLSLHEAHPTAAELLVSKMSTLNTTVCNLSLLSCSLKQRWYWMTKILLRHGADLTFKDDGGLCGNDYLDETKNPGRSNDKFYNFAIDDDFLRECRAIVMSRELSLNNAAKRAPRAL